MDGPDFADLAGFVYSPTRLLVHVSGVLGGVDNGTAEALDIFFSYGTNFGVELNFRALARDFMEACLAYAVPRES